MTFPMHDWNRGAWPRMSVVQKEWEGEKPVLKIRSGLLPPPQNSAEPLGFLQQDSAEGLT